MTSLSPSTATGLEPLQQAFGRYLKAANLSPGLTTVRCSERSGRLLLLAEHGAPEVKEPNDLLKELEAAFRELVPVVGLPDDDWALAAALSVRVYLKLKSAPQAYAMHTFTWHPADAVQMVFPAAIDTVPLDPGVTAAATAAAQALGDAGETAAHPAAPEAASTATLSVSDAALALPEAEVQPPATPRWAKQGRAWTAQGVRSLRYYWSYGLAGLILLGSGAFAYALSRPCVVGSCDRIDQAAQAYALAQATLAGSPNGDELTAAQLDMQSAIDMLAPIPSWSAHHAVAQSSLQQYQGSIAALNALIQAQALASEAASLSQQPPHPVERWVKVHLLWQQAIARLESIPADSPAFDFGQQKLREYRSNSSAIGRRIVAEEEAEANFSTAIQTGTLARQRTETANSLAGWQLAAKEWQAAIKGLTLIPQGTMVYDEAQAQLKDYQQQLFRATNRSTLEEAGAHNYNQAVQAARAAAAYEAKGQWTQAVGQWRQAVASARQIPSDTILAEESGVLLETYQPALNNAQNRLRNAVALQTLTTTLAQLCEFSATPCTVREDPSQIRVVLSSQYAEPLRQAITPPAADGTFAFTNQLSPGAQQLLEQIITVSHQVDRQVAVYDAHGGFVARYRPDLGGFIRN
ncbi:MAG TPA: hypothetical protein VLS96_04070 [Nodosilinea sp.]|nr:hypothetical protein [Nodosilinea sp.]